MPRVLTGLLLALLVAAPAAAWGETVERDGPLPRVERVGPLEDPDALEPGRLTIHPAVTEAVVAPTRRQAVPHVVSNTTDRRLHLHVEVLDARVGPDGPGAGRTGPVPPDAPVRLVAPVDRLVLDPGEGAVIHATAQADPGEAALFSLRVRTDDDEAARAHVVVSADDVPTELGLDLELDATGAATVTLSAARPAVVDVRLRGRDWLGGSSDETLADLLVGGEGRVLDVGARSSPWPGRVHAAAYAVASDTEARTSTSRTVLPPPLLLTAGALVLLAGALLLRRRVTARRGAPSETPGSTSPTP